MIVYALAHTIYIHENEDVITRMEIFDTFDSAYAYFKILEDDIINHYKEYTEEDDFQDLLERDDTWMRKCHMPEREESSYTFGLLDYRIDTLIIRKKNIMRFKLEEC